MISHKYKCIFIHIPKAAGTSVEFALGHRDIISEDGQFKKDALIGRKIQDHRSLRMIEKPIFQAATFLSIENMAELYRGVKFQLRKQCNPNNKTQLTRSQYEEYFKFTIVRNPWSRAFSAYKNIMVDAGSRKRLNITSDITIHEYIDMYKNKGLLRPQTYWIKNLKGEIGVDYICHFESLNEDFQFVREKIKETFPALPHRMKSPDGDYRRHYNNEAIDLVANVYADEIDAFGYEFE